MLDSIFLAFHPSSKKGNEQSVAQKLYSRVIELVLQRSQDENFEARRDGPAPKKPKPRFLLRRNL